MIIKTCSKCNNKYPESKEYFRLDYRYKNTIKYLSACVFCLREKSKIYYNKNKNKIIKAQKDYLNNNQDKKEKRILYSRCHYKKNKERYKELQKQWYQKNKNNIKEYRAIQNKKYYDNKKNREKRNEKLKKRRQEDIEFKIISLIRNRLYSAIRQKKSYKYNSTLKLLGCSVEYFKKYIECFFTLNMTWEKILNGEIHLDHILPCSSFDLKNSEEQEICFHYTNLQPLWAKDNLKKRDKIIL